MSDSVRNFDIAILVVTVEYSTLIHRAKSHTGNSGALRLEGAGETLTTRGERN